MVRRRFVRHMEKPWENPEELHAFDNGWKIVRVQTEWDYGLETWFLDHCLGTKHFATFEIGHRVFSLRDDYEVPRATILGLLSEKTSPYMTFSDLCTMDYFSIGGEEMRILQVRGRNDALATPKAMTYVADWLGIELPKELELATLVFGDDDTSYHDRHLLDEEDRIYTGWTPPSRGPEHGGILRGWLSF